LITAREAVNLSLSHNLDIEVARYQPWIEDQNVFSALGLWDHTLYANTSGERNLQPGVNLLTGVTGGERAKQDTGLFNLGIRKTLPMGASYDLSYSTNRLDTNNAFYLINPVWTDSFNGTITLPLLRNSSVEANTSTLLIARQNREISVDAFERTLTDSVFGVMQAYWDLVFALEARKVKEQSLEVSQRLLDDNRRKFERGLVARIDVTHADAGLAAQQEGILTAVEAVHNAVDRLKRLIDPALLRDDGTLLPLDAPRGPESELDEKPAIERSFAEALAKRPELRQLQRQVSCQEITKVKSENDLLPRLDLTGRGSLNGIDSSWSSATQKMNGDFYDLFVGVALEWSLEGSQARGSLRRAELEKRRLFLQQRNLEGQILLEVREAVRAIKTNEKRIEASRRARVLAQDQLDSEMTRREQGLSTTYRVLEVQEQLVQARTNEIKALIDYNLSWHKLHQVNGSLLEKNGVLLRENLQPRVTLEGR
jgi:outer membrane protein TolC